MHFQTVSLKNIALRSTLLSSELVKNGDIRTQQGKCKIIWPLSSDKTVTIQILLFNSYICGMSHLIAKVKTRLSMKNMMNFLTNIWEVWQMQFVLKTLKGSDRSETSVILRDCNQANWRTWKIYQGKVESIILNLIFRDEWHLLCYRYIQFDLLFLLL